MYFFFSLNRYIHQEIQLENFGFSKMPQKGKSAKTKRTKDKHRKRTARGKVVENVAVDKSEEKGFAEIVLAKTSSPHARNSSCTEAQSQKIAGGDKASGIEHDDSGACSGGQTSGPTNSLTVIRGSFHQGSNIFPIENVGRQRSCNSIAAMCLLRTVPTPQDIDNVLLEGNNLYTNTVQLLKEQGNYKHPYLTVDELLTHFRLGNIMVELEKCEPKFGMVYNESVGSIGASLEHSVQALFQEEDSGILVLKSYMMGVFKSVEGLYVLFDPHSRNIQGESVARGKSIWMGFSSISLLVMQILRLCRSIDQSDFQYELTPIHIKTEGMQEFNLAKRGKRKNYEALKYEQNPDFRENKKQATSRKYETNELHRERKKITSKQKYQTDEDYKRRQKDEKIRKYKTDKQFREGKKTEMRKKYSTDKCYKERQKHEKTKKYKTDKQFKEDKKTEMSKKYSTDECYRERQKHDKRKKYKTDEQFKEDQKTEMRKKYSTDECYRERQKHEKKKKYKTDEQFKEHQKTVIRKKYSTDKLYRARKKIELKKKYERDENYRKSKNEAVKKLYSKDTVHKENTIRTALKGMHKMLSTGEH